jgi:Arc/MetJ-type ribon-helix-helix transcriptional regulator
MDDEFVTTVSFCLRPSLAREVRARIGPRKFSALIRELLTDWLKSQNDKEAA